MSKKKIYLMEHIWFVLAVFCFGYFVYETIVHGFAKSYLLLIFAVVSFLMFYWRKNLRKME